MAVLSIKGSINHKIRTGKGLGSFCNFFLIWVLPADKQMGLIFPKVFCGSLCSLKCVFHSLASGTACHFYFKIIFLFFVFISSIGCSSKNFKHLACGIWLHSKEISGRCSCWSSKNKAALVPLRGQRKEGTSKDPSVWAASMDTDHTQLFFCSFTRGERSLFLWSLYPQHLC